MKSDDKKGRVCVAGNYQLSSPLIDFLMTFLLWLSSYFSIYLNWHKFCESIQWSLIALIRKIFNWNKILIWFQCWGESPMHLRIGTATYEFLNNADLTTLISLISSVVLLVFLFCFVIKLFNKWVVISH